MDTKIKSPLSRIEEKITLEARKAVNGPQQPPLAAPHWSRAGTYKQPRQPGHSWSAYLHTVYILCLINLTVSASQIVHFEPWRELT